MLKIQSVWNASDGWISSTFWKYWKLLAILIRRCCKSSNTNCSTYIKLTAATTPLRWWYQKNYTFTKKVDKKSFKWKKVCFFAFFHFNNFFVTPGHIPAIFDLWDPILSELSHSQSPQHFRTYLQYLETNMETRFIVSQFRKPISIQPKRPKLGNLFGLKAVWQKNHHSKPHFF